MCSVGDGIFVAFLKWLPSLSVSVRHFRCVTVRFIIGNGMAFIRLSFFLF